MWLLVYFIIFICIALLVAVAVQRTIHLRTVRNKINLRLVAMVESGDQSKSFQKSGMLDQRSSTASSNFLWSHLYTLLVQSGLRWNKGRFLLALVGLLLGSHLALTFVTQDLAARFVFGLVLTIVVVYGYVSHARTKRIRLFVLSLPDALGAVVRSLRAGHPLAEGIRMVAEEMPDPIGGEFRNMMDRLAIGAEPEIAMIKMYHSVGSDDVKLMAVTLSVQSGTGGNLAEVFEKLAKTVRQRTMLAVKVKAISAEGRTSAAIMSVFPFILFGIINLASPGYFDSVWASEYSVHMVSICVGGIALGSFILMRMVDFDS